MSWDLRLQVTERWLLEVLTITFAILVSITLVVPSFPPAPLLYEYVRIQQTTLSFWSISIATLFDGIINGLFWTIFIAVTYGLAQLAIPTRELGPLLPMPLAPRLAAPLPDNTLVVSKGSITPPALTLTIRKNPARSPTRTKSAPSMAPKTRIQLKMWLQFEEFESPCPRKSFRELTQE